eukprot:162179_1
MAESEDLMTITESLFNSNLIEPDYQDNGDILYANYDGPKLSVILLQNISDKYNSLGFVIEWINQDFPERDDMTKIGSLCIDVIVKLLDKNDRFEFMQKKLKENDSEEDETEVDMQTCRSILINSLRNLFKYIENNSEITDKYNEVIYDYKGDEHSMMDFLDWFSKNQSPSEYSTTERVLDELAVNGVTELCNVSILQLEQIPIMNDSTLTPSTQKKRNNKIIQKIRESVKEYIRDKWIPYVQLIIRKRKYIKVDLEDIIRKNGGATYGLRVKQLKDKIFDNPHYDLNVLVVDNSENKENDNQEIIAEHVGNRSNRGRSGGRGRGRGGGRRSRGIVRRHNARRKPARVNNDNDAVQVGDTGGQDKSQPLKRGQKNMDDSYISDLEAYNKKWGKDIGVLTSRWSMMENRYKFLGCGAIYDYRKLGVSMKAQSFTSRPMEWVVNKDIKKTHEVFVDVIFGAVTRRMRMKLPRNIDITGAVDSSYNTNQQSDDDDDDDDNDDNDDSTQRFPDLERENQKLKQQHSTLAEMFFSIGDGSFGLLYECALGELFGTSSRSEIYQKLESEAPDLPTKYEDDKDTIKTREELAKMFDGLNDFNSMIKGYIEQNEESVIEQTEDETGTGNVSGSENIIEEIED